MNIMTTEEPTEPGIFEIYIYFNKIIINFTLIYFLFIDLICVEESLMSLEKLDRASPDLWPEQSRYTHYVYTLLLYILHFERKK